MSVVSSALSSVLESSMMRQASLNAVAKLPGGSMRIYDARFASPETKRKAIKRELSLMGMVTAFGALIDNLYKPVAKMLKISGAFEFFARMVPLVLSLFAAETISRALVGQLGNNSPYGSNENEGIDDEIDTNKPETSISSTPASPSELLKLWSEANPDAMSNINRWATGKAVVNYQGGKSGELKSAFHHVHVPSNGRSFVPPVETKIHI